MTIFLFLGKTKLMKYVIDRQFYKEKNMEVYK
jgi:hypothetical protein